MQQEQLQWDNVVNVRALSATKTLEMTRTTVSTMNTVVMSSYSEIVHKSVSEIGQRVPSNEVVLT